MLNTFSVTIAPAFLKLFSLLIGLLGLGFLVAFHELGHFLFAKLFGVRTPSFSIGFGPKIFSKKIGQTEFCLSAIPFGGYVEMAGSVEIGQGEQKEAYATDKGSFAAKPFYQKLCILFGGIFFNLLFAYFTMTILFLTGMPKNKLLNPIPVVTAIRTDSPAEKAGLQVGDRIIAIENAPLENKIDRIQELLATADAQTNLLIERNGTQQPLSTLLEHSDQYPTPLNALGILAFDTEPTPPHSFFEALKKGISSTNKWIIATIMSFSQLRKNVQHITGPIGIVAMTTQAVSTGITLFLLLLVLISINLAILNLIPLPILDGGQILFYSIEALTGKPLPIKIREYIHIATWILFLMLFIYITGKDLYRILNPYIDGIRNMLGI